MSTARTQTGIAGAVPERWQRAGAAAGFVAAVLLVVDLSLLASSPTVGAPAGAVVDYLHRNETVMLGSSYLGAITTLLLIPFLAALRSFVGDGDSAAEWRWTVTVLSGALALSALLVGNALLAAAAELSSRSVDESTPAALFVGAKLCSTFALIPFGGMVLANARTMSSGRTAVGWLVRFGTGIGLLAIVSGAVIFADDEWFGPGEPAVAGMGFLVALWLAAVAFVIVAPDEVSSSPVRPEAA